MPDDPMVEVRRMTARMLGKTLYVVHTVPAAPREQVAGLLPAHLEHQIRLEKAGIMFGAGPLEVNAPYRRLQSLPREHFLWRGWLGWRRRNS